MTNPRWIVVGTSFRDGADQVLAYAIGLAAQSGSRVALVHAHEHHRHATKDESSSRNWSKTSSSEELIQRVQPYGQQ